MVFLPEDRGVSRANSLTAIGNLKNKMAAVFQKRFECGDDTGDFSHMLQKVSCDDDVRRAMGCK